MPMSMLALPRELYLIVCSHLSPADLAHLAGMSKDYYMSVQESLFSHIDINCYGNLVKLVGTLTKQPAVSRISARQRLRWQSLSDAQLRERDVKSLNISLELYGDSGSSKPVTGEVLSRCIGAISRCRGGVRIRLSLSGPWDYLLQQLQSASLPDVRELLVYLGGRAPDHLSERYPRGKKIKLHLWELLFFGSAFPDLQVVEFGTHHSSRKRMPTTIASSAKFNIVEGGGLIEDDGNGFEYNYGIDYGTDYRRTKTMPEFTPFYGLKRMRRIKLRHNILLDVLVLDSLFGSNIVPQNLTHLEIVNCPEIYQTDLPALSRIVPLTMFGLRQANLINLLGMLLQRGFQVLQYLKLHLQPLRRRDWQQDQMKYAHEIEEHPDHHLCNVVREMGQGIRSLDLALPFVCNQMFVQSVTIDSRHGELSYPQILREPAATLPTRIVAQGYKYRRIICWDGFCRHGGKWEDMQTLASIQGEMLSWEIVSAQDGCGSWHLSGCLPVQFLSNAVLKRQLAEEEW